MAFARSRNEDYIYPSPAPSKSAWQTFGGPNTPQYTSLSSPNDDQDTASRQHSNVSVSSGFEPFEHDTSYSSTTAFLGGSDSAAKEQHPLHHTQPGTRWNPGLWARVPWAGVTALVLAILLTFACVVVLMFSNNVPIDEWRGVVQPTVFLSMGTALTNIALTFALYEGVVISFWRRAINGTTLQELHQYWHAGSSLYGAVTGLFRLQGKVTALACIVTVLSVSRGPLMQRATTVENVLRTDTAQNMTFYSAIQLPPGYAGRDTGPTSTPSLMNPNFTNIVQAYTAGDDINGVYDGCGTHSTCHTSVKGFGFGVKCNQSSIPYSLDKYIWRGHWNTLDNNVFSADASGVPFYGYGNIDEQGMPFRRNASSYALLLNTTLMADVTQSYNGSLKQTLCALRGGIVSYPVRVSNGTILLQSSSWRNDTFLQDRVLASLPYNSASNLAGFILAARGLYQGSASYQYENGQGWILNLVGASANRYLNPTTPGRNSYDLETNITWRDPMEDMINSMRELAFRTSLQIAADNTSYPNATQDISFIGYTPKIVYTTNYTYMVTAFAVSMLGIVFVIPTYWGFWTLGRAVSLSPLEIAKAFNAPVLAGVPGNRQAEDMLEEVAFTEVRYGDAGPAATTAGRSHGVGLRKIEIGSADEVNPAQKGVTYI